VQFLTLAQYSQEGFPPQSTPIVLNQLLTQINGDQFLEEEKLSAILEFYLKCIYFIINIANLLLVL